MFPPFLPSYRAGAAYHSAVLLTIRNERGPPPISWRKTEIIIHNARVRGAWALPISCSRSFIRSDGQLGTVQGVIVGGSQKFVICKLFGYSIAKRCAVKVPYVSVRA